MPNFPHQRSCTPGLHTDLHTEHVASTHRFREPESQSELRYRPGLSTETTVVISALQETFEDLQYFEILHATCGALRHCDVLN